MGKYNWTDNQEKAINIKGCDILVSAAAGSGKTAVLTERIIRRLSDPNENVDITDFLIVTFTVAATNELREKLSKAISEAYLNDRSQKKLKKQLFNLPQAKIVTIDSFCKSVAFECKKELGLPADIALGDEGELNAIVEESINEVIDELFSGETYPEFIDTSYLPKNVRRGFLTLVDVFASAKGYDSLNKTVADVYATLMNFPEPFKYCEYILREYDSILRAYYLSSDKPSFFDTKIGQVIIKECREALSVSLELAKKAQETLNGFPEIAEKYSPAIETDIYLFTKALNVTRPSDFLKEISLISFDGLGKYTCNTDIETAITNKFKNYRNTAKDIIGDIQKKYPIYNEERLFAHTADVLSISCELFSVIKKIHDRIEAKKAEKKILSFKDVTHLAYKVLIQDGSYDYSTRTFKKTDYAYTMSEKFDEVFIDEYQDVDELQDTIFRAVSNSHNRFMVGDVKQSIYKFRGATPEIFMEYRNTFLPVDDEGAPESPRLVSLQNNFRSDSSVINFVNELFKVIMNYNSPNVYRDDDKLVFTKNEDLNLPTEVVLLEEDLEYEYIADKIMKLTENEQFNFSDICILAKDHKALAEMQNVLKLRSIPSNYAPKKNFFESYEVATILSTLRAIDNPTDDIALLSLMTSPIFSFLPKELMTLREKNYDTDIYFSIMKYAENGGDEEIKKKCNRILNKLKKWRDMSRYLSSDAFIWQIYEDTHLLNIVKKLNDGDSRKDNLLAFYSIAKTYEEKELRGITKFLYYIDSIKDQERKLDEKEKSENSVQLMTIHTSKGLEFPICFLCNTSSLINRDDEKKKIIFSENFGPAFSIPTGNMGGKVATYARKAAKTQTRISSADEVLRLLYVALTRPKNKLIITGNVNINKFTSFLDAATISNEAIAYSVKNATTIIKMIGIGLMQNKNFRKAISEYFTDIKEADCNSFKLTMYKSYITEGKCYEPKITTLQENKTTLTNAELSFAMRGTDINVSAPYKISVSAVREGLLDESDVDNGVQSIKKNPDFMSLDSSNISAFTGTAMHTFMQFCDFDNCIKSSTQKEAERLLKYNFLTKEQVGVLNHTSLGVFFDSELFKTITRANRVEREKRYTLALPSSDFFADGETKKALDKNNSKTLIQGVIDCYFENKDGSYTIVDFKTDNVGMQDGERILKERHQRQLLLYKKAVELIENVKVKKVLIYSFCLGKVIEIAEN